MKKKLLLILTIFLITGCTGKYDLTITDEEKVNEKIIISVLNDDIINLNYTIDEYLDNNSYVYKNNPIYSEYEIKTKKSNPNSHFIATRTYKNLDEYIKSNSFKSMFNTANIERTDKYITFTTTKNAYLQNIKNDQIVSNEYKYDSFEINIKFYNEVVDNNADKVDKSNNIYTWYVSEDSQKDIIYFKIGPKVKYFVKIKDIIVSNIASIIAVSLIFIIIGLSVLYVIIKSKKNNEI